MHREPTREDCLLDLFFTNKPNLVKASRTIPSLSDHDIVMVDSDIKAHINKQAPKHIHLWSKKDWQKIKGEASDLNPWIILGTIRSTPIMSIQEFS